MSKPTFFNRAVATKEEVVEAGEKALLCLYNNKPADESLNALRYTRFCQKVAQKNLSYSLRAFLLRRQLPPIIVRGFTFRYSNGKEYC